MKIIVFLASIMVSVATFAEVPQFSAFSSGDTLYVTVLGDSCNQLYGSLKLPDDCKRGRFTTNFVPICSAELVYSTTKMMCNDQESIPRVMAISLQDNYVADETRILKLSFNGQEIEVQIRD